MNQAPPALERLVAAVAMVLAFLVMASIFTPDPIRAQNGPAPLPLVSVPYHAVSSDPHEGLEFLGELEHLRYHIHIFASDLGPRYTVLDQYGEALLTLVQAERVAELLPELPVPRLDFRAGPGARLLMLAPLSTETR
jgi:hypothetical protein